MITACEPDGPADVAGLISLDIVVRLDGEPVTGVDDLIRRLNAERIGRAVKLDVLRRGQLRSFEVHPTERPQQVVARRLFFLSMIFSKTASHILGSCSRPFDKS